MPRRQKLQLCAGLTVAAIAPSLLALGGGLYAVRTLSEMLLLFGAAPLLVMGLNLRGRRLSRPVLSMIVFNVLLLSWQLPVVVERTAGSLLLESGGDCLLLLAGIAFWHPVLSGGMAPITKIGYLLIAGCPPTIPGILLGFAHHPLYAASYHGITGLSALEDQQLAGLILFGSAKLALVSATFVLLWRMLGPAEAPGDDEPGQDSPVVPPPLPAWLAQLDQPLAAEPRPLERVLR
jgi:putative membrane protein